LKEVHVNTFKKLTHVLCLFKNFKTKNLKITKLYKMKKRRGMAHGWSGVVVPPPWPLPPPKSKLWVAETTPKSLGVAPPQGQKEKKKKKKKKKTFRVWLLGVVQPPTRAMGVA
jgi:hypothetical protein